MKLSEISNFLESSIPLDYQEDWDNSGIQVGSPDLDISGVIISLDVTEEVIDEAIENGCNLVLSHHPLIFKGIKKITGQTAVERIIATCIRHNIAVYSAHTNLDMVSNGVSHKMARKLGLVKISVLQTLKNRLMKLVTFIPENYLEGVADAIFDAGAGVIGKYDKCGFSANGTGSFRAGENTRPFTGEQGILHYEKEVRFETVFPRHLKEKVIRALVSTHPYEEVAYDVYSLENDNIDAGLGCIGEFAEPLEETVFLNKLKSVFMVGSIRHSGLRGKPIKTVAVCGGSGASLVNAAIRHGADAFITGDIKYHAFQEVDNRLLLVDCGHYETEKSSAEILHEMITKKFPNFAVRFSKMNVNPINYL